VPVTVTPVTKAVLQSATQKVAILTSSTTAAKRLASVSKINSEIFHSFYVTLCFIFDTKSFILFIRIIYLGFMWFRLDKFVKIIVIL